MIHWVLYKQDTQQAKTQESVTTARHALLNTCPRVARRLHPRHGPAQQIPRMHPLLHHQQFLQLLLRRRRVRPRPGQMHLREPRRRSHDQVHAGLPRVQPGPLRRQAARDVPKHALPGRQAR